MLTDIERTLCRITDSPADSPVYDSRINRILRKSGPFHLDDGSKIAIERAYFPADYVASAIKGIGGFPPKTPTTRSVSERNFISVALFNNRDGGYILQQKNQKNEGKGKSPHNPQDESLGPRWTVAGRRHEEHYK